MYLLISPRVEFIMDSFYYPCNFWSCYHPTSKGSWVVGETNSSSISFDEGIVLLLCLVDGEGREHLVGLFHSELSIIEHFSYLRVFCWRFSHVSEMNRDPSSIVVRLSQGTMVQVLLGHPHIFACHRERTQTGTHTSSSITISQKWKWGQICGL